ncbi:MAG TPA: ABC transporter substrate-binding protein [Kineosporiaceae bacterium]|jgi:peptide/nickel transport system substrate-binding protein|nr:ABC transporter substrate-binding protein [Kineosporiaceae bacterium]
MLRLRTAAVALAAALALGACTAVNRTPVTLDSTLLRTALQADIATFDPDNNFEVAGLGAIKAVYQGLVSYRPGTTQVEGVLAQSWQVSPDQRTYTFTIRRGVTFHDGSPMTARSVLASFQRRSNPKLGLSYFLANVKAMTAPDDTTFVVTLTSPQPSLLDNLSSPWGPKVVGPDALVTHKGADASASYLDEHADGTGPYRLASFQRGQRYVLERFDRYWGPRPEFDRVQLSIVPDIGQQVLQLRTGELDVMLHGYPYNQLVALSRDLAIEKYDDLGLEMAFVNPHRNLKDLQVRRLVQAAANPAGWVKDAFGGYATPAQSLFPQVMIKPARPFPFPAAGRANGTPVEIAYSSEEASVQQRIADLLIAQLDAAGFQATARAIPGDQVPTFAKKPQDAPDVFLAQNNPDSAFPGTQTDLFYATGAPLNIFAYSNPAADALFTKAAATTDKAARDATYLQGARLVFDDAAFVPLADVQDVIVHRVGLTDLGTRPAVPWNIDFGSVRRGTVG